MKVQSTGTDQDWALQAMAIALIIAVKTKCPEKANAEIFRELLQTLQDTDRLAEAIANAIYAELFPRYEKNIGRDAAKRGRLRVPYPSGAARHVTTMRSGQEGSPTHSQGW